jgi:hypothetical protein
MNFEPYLFYVFGTSLLLTIGVILATTVKSLITLFKRVSICYLAFFSIFSSASFKSP